MKSSYIKQIKDVTSLQNKILDWSLLAFAYLGSIAFLLTTVRASHYGFSANYFIQSLEVIVVILVGFFRKKLSLNFKVIFIAIIIFILLASSFGEVGFLASAKVYIAIIPVIISFIVNLRKALIILSIYIALYITYGYFYSSHILQLAIDANEYITKPYIWLLDGFIILLTSIGLLIIANAFNKTILDNYTIMQNHTNELYDKEERYRMLFQSNNDSIIILSEGESNYCNDRTYQLFKCEHNKDYIQNRAPYEFSPEFQPDGSTSKNKALWYIEKAKNEGPQTFEWQHKRFDGETFDTLVTLNKVILKNKNYIQAVVRDITKQKKAEEELNEYKNYLEDLVKKRTEELEETNTKLSASNNHLQDQHEELKTTIHQLHETQERLIESEKMASIGLLAAGVAHEINNPLNFINMGIYSIEGTFVDLKINDQNKEVLDTQKQIIKNMSIGVERITTIVKSLNHFNRNSSNEMTRCDLHTIIDNCFTILNHELKNRIEIIKHFDPLPIISEGNEGRLHQLFLNIISNAAQAIENSGTITVTTALNDKKDHANITLEDNGMGILESNIKHIFEPFFTTKEVGKGTGLGLSISYSIIQEHNGTIAIESIPNSGTKVIIQLPVNH